MKMRFAAFAVGTTLALNAQAESFFQLEAGFGIDTYQTMNDGTWQQEGAPYNHVKLIFPAAQIGVRVNTYEATNWGISLHADYVYLGNVQSNCWCTPDDSLYNPATKRIAPSNIPLAHFVGHGNAQGIALTIEPYLKRGKWHLGIEGGLFPYRPQWDETVSNWSPAAGVPPTTIHAHTPNALQLGFVVGVSLERGNFGVSLRHYFLQPFGTISQSPPIYNTATVLMATWHY